MTLFGLNSAESVLLVMTVSAVLAACVFLFLARREETKP